MVWDELLTEEDVRECFVVFYEQYVKDWPSDLVAMKYAFEDCAVAMRNNRLNYPIVLKTIVKFGIDQKFLPEEFFKRAQSLGSPEVEHLLAKINFEICKSEDECLELWIRLMLGEL
jgi:hypothetical protein